MTTSTYELLSVTPKFDKAVSICPVWSLWLPQCTELAYGHADAEFEQHMTKERKNIAGHWVAMITQHRMMLGLDEKSWPRMDVTGPHIGVVGKRMVLGLQQRCQFLSSLFNQATESQHFPCVLLPVKITSFQFNDVKLLKRSFTETPNKPPAIEALSKLLIRRQDDQSYCTGTTTTTVITLEDEAAVFRTDNYDDYELSFNEYWDKYIGVKMLAGDHPLLSSYMFSQNVTSPLERTLDIYVNPAWGSRFCLPVGVNSDSDALKMGLVQLPTKEEKKTETKQEPTGGGAPVLLYHGRDSLWTAIPNMMVEPIGRGDMFLMSAFSTTKDETIQEEFYNFEVKIKIKQEELHLACFFALPLRQITHGLLRLQRKQWVEEFQARIEEYLLKASWDNMNAAALRRVLIRDLAESYFVMTSLMIIDIEIKGATERGD